MSKTKKILIVIVIILAAAAVTLLCIYYWGRGKYEGKFLPGTTINGTDMTEASLQEYVDKTFAAYPVSMTITEKDGTETVIDLAGYITNTRPEEITDAEAEDLDQWFMRWFEPRAYETDTVIRYQEDALEADIETALNKVPRTASKDACLDIESMTVVPEVIGNEIDTKAVAAHVVQLVKDQQFALQLKDEYILPKVYRDDESLTSTVEEYHEKIERKIPVIITDGIKKSITEKQLAKWITYDGEKYHYDKKAIQAYAENLAVKYNTAYSARDFETSLGTVISVGTGPNDSYAGWMLDEEATADAILQAVKGKTEKARAEWILTGYTLDKNANDIGGTYIEISVDDQHMWYYEDYELILDTDVVTGTETDPKRRTPRGLFYLLEMESPYVMHGDYGEQPCEYFIKVTWDGVAIHDADWQPVFGGTIYQYAGSHGCINTPHAIVAELYERIYAMDNWQMPVIIY